MAAFQQIPLVGPGSELQLTLDGRAVPYAEVVRAHATPPAPRVVARASDPVAGDRAALEGQTSLPR